MTAARVLLSFAVWFPLGFVLSMFGLAVWQVVVVALLISVANIATYELEQ